MISVDLPSKDHAHRGKTNTSVVRFICNAHPAHTYQKYCTYRPTSLYLALYI